MSNLEKIDFTLCDFSNMNVSYTTGGQTLSTTAGMFSGCSKLTNIVGGLPNLKVGIGVNPCPLTVASATTLLNSLSSTPISNATLRFKSSMKTTYEADADFNAAVATVTANGWTIAYA